MFVFMELPLRFRGFFIVRFSWTPMVPSWWSLTLMVLSSDLHRLASGVRGTSMMYSWRFHGAYCMKVR